MVNEMRDSENPANVKKLQGTDNIDRWQAEEELRNTQARLSESLKELKDIKMAVDEHAIIAVTNPQGVITYANNKFCALSKYSREELIGQDHRIINSGHHSKEFIRNLWETIAHGKIWKGEIRNRAKDGTFYWLDTTIVPFLDANSKPWQYVAIRTDVTERKAAEARIARLGQLYAALSKCNQAIVHSHSAEELMQIICRDVVEFGGLKMAWFGLIDEETGLIQPKTAFGIGAEYVKGIVISVSADDPSGLGPVGTAIRENTPSWFEDFQNDPRTAPWQERAAHYGWMTVASLPIRMRGKPIGALSIYSDTLQVIDEEVRKLLIDMANEISFAFDSFDRETKRKRAEEGLLKAKTEAEEANQAKDQFIAVLSHELRTPLTPILLSSSVIEAEESIPEDIRAELRVIRRNVELEMKLIDDLLDVTKINRGLIQLHQATVDAHACLRNALEICLSEVAVNHLNISLQLEAAHPHVWADSARLQQVFWNLLRNAIKFTPAGGEIRIQSINRESRLCIKFSDTGIGIDPDMLPSIFKAFEQAEKGKIRRFGGLGLGLSIAKKVIELHHGTLCAFSEGLDKGSAFTVELPTVPEAQALPVPTPFPTPLQGDVFKKILLVEDHADTLRILTKLLQKWGYMVKTANCVQQALAEITKEPIDLLVSDIGLPDGSGLEIMQRVKSLYGTRGIAISGFGTEEDIHKSHAAGFEKHIIKPVNIQVLQTAVQRSLSETS